MITIVQELCESPQRMRTALLGEAVRWRMLLVFCGVVFTFIFSINLLADDQFYASLDPRLKNARFKKYVTNSNGGVDVIFHIPETPTPVKNKTKASQYLRQEVTVEVKREFKKTIYPATLTSPYLINNPSLCDSKKKLNYVVIVHTSTDHFKRRSVIRETWGNSYILRNSSFRIAFLFGLAKDSATQIMLENESTVYGDIVQGYFADTYHNLTHKGVLAYRWVHEFCSNVEMVVKVDDDMFVNVFYLMEYYLPLYRTKSRYISCHLRPKGTSMIMRSHSKWKVSDDKFRNMTHYPVPYCNGYFVLISIDIIRELFRASFLTPFFWVDDVYLYGLLPFRIGNVHFEKITNNLTLNQHVGMSCFTGNKTCKYVAAYAQIDGFMEKMWYASLKMFYTIAKKYISEDLLLT